MGCKAHGYSTKLCRFFMLLLTFFIKTLHIEVWQIFFHRKQNWLLSGPLQQVPQIVHPVALCETYFWILSFENTIPPWHEYLLPFKTQKPLFLFLLEVSRTSFTNLHNVIFHVTRDRPQKDWQVGLKMDMLCGLVMASKKIDFYSQKKQKIIILKKRF